LQLLGSILTLGGLFSATTTMGQRLRALFGALWRSEASSLVATLSELNKEDKTRILQGLSVITIGYLLALVSQVWTNLTSP
jgi:hypothetical protein